MAGGRGQGLAIGVMDVLSGFGVSPHSQRDLVVRAVLRPQLPELP
jgi:hypothetical protein